MNAKPLTEKEIKDLAVRIVKLLKGLTNEQSQQILRIARRRCQNNAIVKD